MSITFIIYDFSNFINENKLFNIRGEPGIKKIYVEETPSPACISSVSMRWIDLWDELLPDLLS